MKICIDPGHGIETAGKRSFDGSLLEYEFNFDVAHRLKKYLELAGIKVVMTRDDEHDVSLAERCRIANAAKADIFISIHANAFGTTWNGARGWEAYVWKKGAQAEKIAEAIRSESMPLLGLIDRGVKEADFYVLKNTTMPAVLIEHGFYTNKEECALLKTSNFREKCAVADAKGILKCAGKKFVESPKPISKADAIAPEGKLYKVQVGAFKDKDNAQAMLDKLKKAGFDGFIKEE
ncbi:N-acetylmuramoyl-L-alanine amidase [Tepidanaerobacter syntrophicus]|uniref:N-acetylmuramoyl-L-alanine amidase n=1 Tax=Tepidanaerobacter syntrophicus TaxID=224999 RepID=UPI001BD400CC|nr:N-acetylmuramoyl-L-alanine amidase [Tepidanaerobacter syntrophicus]